MRLARLEGLQVVSVDDGTRHTLLTLENMDGAKMRQPISKGGFASASPHWRNLRANFRRFSKGYTHGIDVLP